MEHIFDEPAATDAAADLLRRAGGQASCLRILHMLYLAERRALSERGVRITGCRFAGLASGPVPAEILDLARGAGPCATWRSRIRPEEDRLRLLDGPEAGELSSYAARTLEDVYLDVGEIPLADLTRYLREHCPEWAENPQAPDIPAERILLACGKTTAQILQAVEDAACYAAVRRYLAKRSGF